MKILLSISLFIVLSCGTEVGNPLTDLFDGDNGSSVPGLPQGGDFVIFTGNLELEVCKKLVECFSSTVTQDLCRSGISSVDGFDIELGLDSNIYSSFSEIKTAESNSIISPNSASASQCLTDIKSLLCSDSEVISSYDSSSASDYSLSYLIIPSGSGSCNDAF